MIKRIFPLIYIKKLDISLENKAILCLENSYFNIFKIKIENVLSKEDRIFKIEDNLEIIFPKYNNEKFTLDYEILEKEEDDEYLAVYILNNSKLKNIFSDKNKYKILSVIPSFFKVREVKECSDFYNFDISSSALVISKYENFNLKDINIFQNEYSFINDNIQENFSYYNIINSYIQNIEKENPLFFTGIEPDFNALNLENKNYKFFNVEELDFTKYLNFLPKDLQKRYIFYRLNFKYLTIIFVITFFSILSSFFLLWKITKIENDLSNLQTEREELEEENKNIRKEISEIEKNYKDLEQEEKQLKIQDFKISEFLNEFYFLCPSNILLSLIELDDNKIFNIVCHSSDFLIINLLLENLQKSKNFEVKNYDYIMNKNNDIEFKLELKYSKNLGEENEIEN